MAELRLEDEDQGGANPAEDVSVAQLKRLEFLDLLLAWDGSFGRKDLTEFFGISDQQASADISKYREFAPDNSRYDTKSRTHIVTDEYAPVFVKPSADRYLDQLVALSENVIDDGQKWFRQEPVYDVVPKFHPDVKNDILRRILKMIREKRAVKIRYQPLTRTEASQRWIAPHALAFSGRRWHVRAYCFESSGFRDFVLTRIMDATESKQVVIETDETKFSSLDTDWHNPISVKIVPCRSLSDDQQRVIAKDYGMDIRGKTVSVRQALLLYFVDWHRLDPKRYGQIPDMEKMIEAENWDEIAPFMPPNRQ